MRKELISIISALSAMTISAAAAPSAEYTVDENGGSFASQITGLEKDKYYTVTAITENKSIDNDAYIFANGRRTAVPVNSHTVYIRGVKPDDTGAIAVGAVSDGTLTVSDISVSEGEEYTFYAAGDITESNYISSLGGKYYNNDGKESDPVAILAENGMNMARIRLSNDPGKGRGDGVYYLPDGFQDPDDCLDLARRAKDNGMAIEFTFNFSDYWSNAERQIVPAEWAEKIKTDMGYDITDVEFLTAMTDSVRTEISDKLAELVSSYVKDIMTRLKEQNTVPEYVSLGNEVNGGILFPFAASFDMKLSKENLNAVWDDPEDVIPMPADTAALAKIMNAGYDAVKEISPETEVVLHLANGAKYSSYTWALDIYNKAGVKYDILGASYYPAWSDATVETCVEFCNTLYENYKKPILIMETGFNWNSTVKNGKGGQLIPIDAYKELYPDTKEGQKGYLADLYNGLRSVKDGACIGAIYWDPLMIHVEDPKNANESLSGWAYRESDDLPDGNVVENTTLFDFDGNMLPVFDVIENSSDFNGQYINLTYDENGSLTSASSGDTKTTDKSYYFTGDDIIPVK